MIMSATLENDNNYHEIGQNMIKDAGEPFNDPSANFILRTSDNVDFRVH